MPHYSRVQKVVIDVAEPTHDATRDFWQNAIGHPMQRIEQHPEYHGLYLPGGDFAVLIQRLENGPPRVHLDIHTDDLDAEVARLETLGAVRVAAIHHWWVMRDPAGLPFCVLPAPVGSLTDENACRWE